MSIVNVESIINGTPEKRVLLKVMMDEDNSSEIDVTFTTLMGDKVEPRKEWIEENVEFSLEDDYKI